MSEAQHLVHTLYPSFLDTFNSYDARVKQGDALRYILLDAFGGLYLDVDISCWTPVDVLLRGYDVVLQGIEPGRTDPASMASIPGHSIWQHVHQTLHIRAKEQLNPVLQTGPELLLISLQQQGIANETKLTAGEHAVKGTKLMVYPLGTAVAPCAWNDKNCHVDMAVKSAANAGC
jgi:mannosyltransferase OCH1-like enzyme